MNISHSFRTAGSRIGSWGSGLLRDSAYLFLTFPLTLFSFVVMVTLLSLSVSLAIFVGGFFIAAASLYVAHWMANVERSRLTLLGMNIPSTTTLPGKRPVSVWLRSVLADRDLWREAAHAIVALPLSVFTWSVALTWWAGTLAGLTYWIWDRFLPQSDENVTLTELLNLPISNSILTFIVGLIFLATLVPVISGCTRLQVALSTALLTPSKAALAQRIDALATSRAKAAEAEASALRKLERDLHDGPQQGLTRLGMDLSLAERKLSSDNPESALETIREARTATDRVINEIRALARGIAPPILADRGLVAALSAATASSIIPVELTVDFPADVRLPTAVENTLYFATCEALANAAKHSEATSITVSLTLAEAHARAEIEDNGNGGALTLEGHGLAGIIDRAQGVDGSVEIIGVPGEGTRIVVEVPCE